MNPNFASVHMLATLIEDEEISFFSSDYEMATDNLEHGIALYVVRRFLKGLDLLSPYMDNCLRLLLSPREVDEEESWRTTKGIL
jgi:hypothetical protein